MTDDTPLSRKINALIRDEPFENGAMHLGPSGNADALIAMLQAIDVTMLPRDVVFSVGASHVTLAVSGKRVRTLVAASDDLSATQGLVGHLLTAEDTASLTQLAVVLTKLAKLEGTVTLQRNAVSGTLGAADAGIGLRTLSNILGVDPNAKPASPLMSFIQSLSPVMYAHAYVADGAMMPVEGDADMAKALMLIFDEVWSRYTDDHAKLRGDGSTDKMLSLDGLLPQGALASFICLDGTCALIATQKNSVAAVAEAWSRATS